MPFSHVDCFGVPLEKKIDELFNKTNGFFIELGANDGLSQSNTAFLEFNKNWTGILIEPSSTCYDSCKKNRPNSTVLNYACVSNDYCGNVISGDFMDNDLMSSIDGLRLKRNATVNVPASTLESILDKHSGDKIIDFLSLDTEGYEMNILKGLNLKKYRPKYMLIEIYTKDFTDIVLFLIGHNYSLQCNFTNYNTTTNPHWDGTHNDYLFMDMR